MNRGGVTSSQGSVPMNLFATWEIDRSSSSCIPRIFSMSVCKLVIQRELDKDAQSVFVAVKMQGSKRIFRSNEIFLPSNGQCSALLELTFSLQYPHFIKRDENGLQIMLQRKNRYKNRAMLGYKTLAVGRIDLAQVIQFPIPQESTVELFTSGKDNHGGGVVVAAHIICTNISSLPIDSEMDNERTGKQRDRSPDVDNYSDEEDETYSSEQELGSDNPQEFADDEAQRRKRKSRRKVRMSSSSRQQNFIKTKVAALLRKFKQVADEDLEPGMSQDQDNNTSEHHYLFDDLDDFNLSDSCPEVEDNISIISTPKPQLRPFFDRISHSSSQTEISSLRDQIASEENYFNEVKYPASAASNENEEAINFNGNIARNNSHQPISANWQEGQANNHNQASISAPSSPDVNHPPHISDSSRKSWNRSASFKDRSRNTDDQLAVATTKSHSNDSLSENEIIMTALPETLFLIDGDDKIGRLVGNALKAPNLGLAQPIVTRSSIDIQAVFASFLLQLHKYMNNNSQSPVPVKTVVFGSDHYFNLVLQEFVEHLSAKSSDWQSFVVFYFVPLGVSKMTKYLGSIDTRYSSLFLDATWKELLERLSDASDRSTENQDLLTLASKIKEYISEAASTVSIPIAEAMVTFRQHSGDEDCSQKFFPFISEVRVGENEVSSLDSDREEVAGSNQQPGVGQSNAPAPLFTSPPSSPSVAFPNLLPATSAVPEVKLGLQVDYWKERDASKHTLKTNFKSFHVSRLPQSGERQSPGLTLDTVTKGKKIMMRLPGKKGKEKESETRSQAVGNISRLICTSKHQHSLLKVKIDGIEWRGIKFFQLSAHWSTHVKFLQVAIFSSF